MKRYYFSCEGAQTFRDVDGTELDDDHCAMMQAIQNAGEVLTDHAEAFAQKRHWRMTVSDETGRVAFSLSFKIDQ